MSVVNEADLLPPMNFPANGSINALHRSTVPGEKHRVAPLMMMVQGVVAAARQQENTRRYHTGVLIKQPGINLMAPDSLIAGDAYGLQWKDGTSIYKGEVMTTPVGMPPMTRDQVLDFALTPDRRFAIRVDPRDRVVALIKSVDFPNWQTPDEELQGARQLDQNFTKAGVSHRLWSVRQAVKMLPYCVGIPVKLDYDGYLRYLATALSGSGLTFFTGDLSDHHLMHYDPRR